MLLVSAVNRVYFEVYLMFSPGLVLFLRSMNVIDNMLHMLEQHAEHLEDLVKERQAQLDEEKKKVELLLCNMLPK